MPLSEAKKAADKRYVNKLDNIMIRPYREEGSAIRAAAAAAGMSVQAYVLQAVRAWIEREQAAGPERTETVGTPALGSGFGISAGSLEEREPLPRMLEGEDLSYQDAKETVDNLRARLSRSPNRARTIKVIERITETTRNGDKNDK